MKDKIKDIIIGVEMTTIEPEEAVNKLFDLFVEQYEQGGNGLFGKQHQAEQCFLYNVSNCTTFNSSMFIRPVFDGTSIVVTQYQVVDALGQFWFEGTKEGCEQFLYSYSR